MHCKLFLHWLAQLAKTWKKIKKYASQTLFLPVLPPVCRLRWALLVRPVCLIGCFLSSVFLEGRLCDDLRWLRTCSDFVRLEILRTQGRFQYSLKFHNNWCEYTKLGLLHTWIHRSIWSYRVKYACICSTQDTQMLPNSSHGHYRIYYINVKTCTILSNVHTHEHVQTSNLGLCTIIVFCNAHL